MVMPSLPYPETGAEQSDRAWGIRLLRELGYEVKVLAKWPEFKAPELLENARQEFGVEIVTVPYVFSNTRVSKLTRVKKYFYQLLHPAFWDGAALEYNEPIIKKKFSQLLDEWQPDIVWFEYTYLCPLYSLAQKRGLKIVTRSLNFEPDHFWQEDGGTLINRFIYWAKLASEKKVIKKSNFIFAITPDEAERYRQLGAKKVAVLPLRGLHSFVGENLLASQGKVFSPAQIFFLGSTYNVAHNLQALKFLVKEVVPLANKAYPDSFIFNIFGAKVPVWLTKNLPTNVVIHGYVADLSSALAMMDLAIIPSLFGAGMQQKIFEPIARGVPTITSPRGLAGYPFKNGVQLLLADSSQGFVDALGRLIREPNLGSQLSQEAVALSQELFAKEGIKGMIRQSLR